MAIITTDILLKGMKRDRIFEWLGDFRNHKIFLQEAFHTVEEDKENLLLLGYGQGIRKRIMGYAFLGKDDEHGGRRINIQTTGKRTSGQLSFSLRSMRASPDTLVTIYMDYSPGGMLGGIVNSAMIREDLEKRFAAALQNLGQELASAN